MSSDDFIDSRTLSQEEREELARGEGKYVYSNVYDPSEYEENVEILNPGVIDLDKTRMNLWGRFQPTRHQWDIYQFFTQREAMPGKPGETRLMRNLEGVFALHRRFGKSVGLLLEAFLPWILERPGTYLHVFPSLTQGRAAIWNGMGEITRDGSAAVKYLELFPRELWKKKNNHDMSIEFVNGSIYRIVGARGADGTANHLRGLNAVGVGADEYAEWMESVFNEVFSPILGQNGGWAAKIFTPKGENHAYDDYMFALEQERLGNPRFKALCLGIEDTYYNDGEAIVKKEYVEMLLAKGMDPELVSQEFYCSFKANASGAWYKHAMTQVSEQDRIGVHKYNPTKPIDAIWDLGGNDAHAVGLIQMPDMERINFVDYVRMDNVPVGDVMDVVNRYPIRTHYFPHDGAKRLDMVTAFQTRVEALRKEKGITNIKIVPRTTTIIDGIEKVKALLPFCWFDKEKSYRLVDDLKNYKKSRNQQTGTFLDRPIHDKHSHGADMVRTLATAYYMGMIDPPTVQSGWAKRKADRSKVARKSVFSWG